MKLNLYISALLLIGAPQHTGLKIPSLHIPKTTGLEKLLIGTIGAGLVFEFFFREQIMFKLIKKLMKKEEKIKKLIEKVDATEIKLSTEKLDTQELLKYVNALSPVLQAVFDTEGGKELVKKDNTRYTGWKLSETYGETEILMAIKSITGVTSNLSQNNTQVLAPSKKNN